MRRFSSIALASVLFLGAMAANASACLNDREIENQERFFKSSYIEKPTQSPSPETPKTGEQLLVYGGIGGGTALLIGAFAIGIIVSRKS